MIPREKSARILATVILLVFCIQYIPIESRASVSVLKLGISVLSPLIILLYEPKISRTFILWIIYFALVICAALRFPETLRWSTIIYMGSFIVMFLAYYNLVKFGEVFSSQYFIRLLEKLLLAYTVVLLLQQCFILVGIKTFPLINLVQNFNRGIGANSLSYEPSTAAMVMGAVFLSLLRMLEIEYGRKLSVKEVFKIAKWPTIGFLWSMLTMGSGTAFVCLALLSLYFITAQNRKVVSTCLFLGVAIFCFINIDYEPLNRARDTLSAFFTLNVNIAIDTDASSAYRTQLWINTLTNLKLDSLDGWLGHGVDYGKLTNEKFFNPNVMIGNISDYGFLSFIVLVAVVYSGMIKNFFSIETLFWAIILLASLNNEPFRWGCMMLFSTVRYFQIQE